MWKCFFYSELSSRHGDDFNEGECAFDILSDSDSDVDVQNLLLRIRKLKIEIKVKSVYQSFLI